MNHDDTGGEEDRTLAMEQTITIISPHLTHRPVSFLTNLEIGECTWYKSTPDRYPLSLPRALLRLSSTTYHVLVEETTGNPTPPWVAGLGARETLPDLRG